GRSTVSGAHRHLPYGHVGPGDRAVPLCEAAEPASQPLGLDQHRAAHLVATAGPPPSTAAAITEAFAPPLCDHSNLGRGRTLRVAEPAGPQSRRRLPGQGAGRSPRRRGTPAPAWRRTSRPLPAPRRLAVVGPGRWPPRGPTCG